MLGSLEHREVIPSLNGFSVLQLQRYLMGVGEGDQEAMGLQNRQTLQSMLRLI